MDLKCLNYFVTVVECGSIARASARLRIAQPALGWHLERDGGRRWLVMTNRGRVHARITQVAFDAPGARSDVARGLLGYVLPGARMRWELPDSVKLAAQPKLVATVNGVAGVAIEPDAADAH